ncbi:polysaccharide pyruvyl transferase family protein [Bacillus haimaensis]|uniref:polysaccharide pyruvyl transferase family protein n=1 Tax=Bacillus haimaensis TaxID=3160967 RepID=UPI003AA8C8D0
MNVTIIGWFGEKNIGDDLILNSIHERVVETINPKHVYVASNKKTEGYNWIYDHDFSLKSWIKLFVRGNIVRNLKSLYSSDVIIFCIGGGLSDWNKEVMQRVIKKIQFYKYANKRIFFIGVGAGPFVGNFHGHILHKELRKIEKILVRDNTSLTNLNKLELKNVSKTNDIVFENNYLNSFFETNKSEIKMRNQVSIIPVPLFYNSLWKENERKFKEYISTFNDMLRYLNTVYEVVKIIPFQKEFDEKYLIKHLDSDINFEIFKYEEYEQVYKEMICSKLIIPMRFHGLVLSTIFEVPSIPVIYDHKLYDLSEELNLENICLDLGDGGNWRDHVFTINEFIESHNKITSRYEETKIVYRKYKIQANKNTIFLKGLM